MMALRVSDRDHGQGHDHGVCIRRCLIVIVIDGCCRRPEGLQAEGGNTVVASGNMAQGVLVQLPVSPVGLRLGSWVAVCCLLAHVDKVQMCSRQLQEKLADRWCGQRSAWHCRICSMHWQVSSLARMDVRLAAVVTLQAEANKPPLNESPA